LQLTGETADAVIVWLSTEFCDCVHGAGDSLTRHNLHTQHSPTTNSIHHPQQTHPQRALTFVVLYAFHLESAAKAKDSSDGTSAAAAGLHC
jgi:hypothetical protein